MSLPANAGDMGSIPGSGRSPWSGRSPGEENGNPFQYSCLGNSMENGACPTTVHGVTKNWTQLSDPTTRDSLIPIWYSFITWWWCSVAQSCPALDDLMDSSMPGSLSFTISWSLLKLTSIESVMSPNHFILGRPLLLPPSDFPSIRVFSNESALHIRWPKYWSFSISSSNEYSGLISFRIDWFDLLAVQETLKSLQHHSSKASILQHSAFLMIQLSHPYMTTGKTIALARWIFVGKVTSLLFILFIYLFFGLEHFIFFSFIFISWRLITLQYCSGFCHTLIWIIHGFTCVSAF